MSEIQLIKPDYSPLTKTFIVKKPDIVSGAVYYFETESKLVYQVTFGKKRNNYLGNIVNFSVISEDYEDEYSETNRGEIYSIISTMIEILRTYHEAHPYSNSYEFSGEYKDSESKEGPSIRTKLYVRSAHLVVDMNYWELSMEGNKVILSRKARNE